MDHPKGVKVIVSLCQPLRPRRFLFGFLLALVDAVGTEIHKQSISSGNLIKLLSFVQEQTARKAA